MTPKTKIVFVTHLHPDLDSLMGLWLLWDHVYKNHKKSLRFVPVGKKIKSKKRTLVHVDTGKIDFDHHQTSKYECAASLVMKKYHLDKDSTIQRMVHFTLLADHGKLFDYEIDDFNMLNVIYGLNKIYKEEPLKVVRVSFEIFDALYVGLSDINKAEKDFRLGIKFRSKWGLSIGFNSKNSRLRSLAYKKGFILFVFKDKLSGFAGYALNGSSSLDISELYYKVKKLEPQADWFLHSSHQLVLCGSQKAPNKKLSKLSLKKLIELAR